MAEDDIDEQIDMRLVEIQLARFVLFCMTLGMIFDFLVGGPVWIGLLSGFVLSFLFAVAVIVAVD